MQPKPYHYLAFPHTVLSELQLRHLSILLPHLSVLEIARPLDIPQWGKEQFSTWKVVEEEGLVKRIRANLKGLQDAAALRGVGGILSSIAGEWGKGGTQESRFRIESRLRGTSPDTPDMREVLLLEAALFLELARDLDEREMELEAGLSQIDALEEQFREILGAANEEEIREELETAADYPLASDRAYLSFMLPRRIASWYRMLALRPPEDPSVLVAITPEVAEELLEPARTEWAHQGKGVETIRQPLASIPSLDRLDAQMFLDLKAELQGAEALVDSYQRQMEAVLGDPNAAIAAESLYERIRDIRELIENFCRNADALGEKQVQLTLIRFGNLSHDGLWSHFDRAGRENMGATLSPALAPTMLLLE